MRVTTAADLLRDAEQLCYEMRSRSLAVTQEDWTAVEAASRHALTQVIGLAVTEHQADPGMRRTWEDLGKQHPLSSSYTAAGVDAVSPSTLPRLAMVLSVLGDVLAHDPHHVPEPIPSDDQVEAARRILSIIAVTARQAIATGRLADGQGPFDAGRQAESLLDALGAPRSFPMSLRRIQSASLAVAVSDQDALAQAAALWDSAFRAEMSRSIIPSLDVLRALANTGRHAYAVSVRAAQRLEIGVAPERLGTLIDAAHALGGIEENWPKVATTLVKPGHHFIGASRDLYVALAHTQKELEAELSQIDLGAAARSVRWLSDRVAQHVADNSRLPERLLQSGLVFAPAGTVRPTPERLPARTKRRFTAADICDYPTFVDAWDRAGLATQAARSHVLDDDHTLRLSTRHQLAIA